MEKKTWVKVGTVMENDQGKQYVSLNVGGNPKKEGLGAVKVSVKTETGWQELKMNDKGKLFLSFKKNEDPSKAFIKGDLITAIND